MRFLARNIWFAGIGSAVLVAFLLGVVCSAQAAFPGRNGLLAVQPLEGQDTVLIHANGKGRRLVCVYTLPAQSCGGVDRYGDENRPIWSSDGRELLLDGEWGSPGSDGAVAYADGSCLNCNLHYMAGAAFESNPTLFTALSGQGQPAPLVEWGIDGLARRVLLSGPVSDPVWSSRNELAVMRGGWIWIGRPGKLQRFARGRTPSWSPDGRRIVFVRRGWLMTAAVPRGSAHKLVHGTAPAWSPDGKWIAFFGNRHRLSLVQASGGRARRVGAVVGWTVDWQPIPNKPPVACRTPPGSRELASSNTGAVTVATIQQPPVVQIPGPFTNTTSWSAMGCLRSDGRERVLATSGSGMTGSNIVSRAAVAGNYAALVVKSSGFNRYTRLEESDSQVQVLDLRGGCVVTCNGPPARGGEDASCADAPGTTSGTSCDIDQLLLGSDAVSAVHTTSSDNGCTCTVEQIQASDSLGLRTLDSVTEPDGTPSSLTNLVLAGDILIWEHDGTPRSIQLQP